VHVFVRLAVKEEKREREWEERKKILRSKE